MNTEFDALRQRAKEYRDSEIRGAKADYKRILKQINDLQKAMTGKRPYQAWNGKPGYTNAMTLRDAIVAVIGNRRMTRTEVAVGVLELGYKTATP